jgi:hypothetical protein
MPRSCLYTELPTPVRRARTERASMTRWRGGLTAGRQPPTPSGWREDVADVVLALGVQDSLLDGGELEVLDDVGEDLEEVGGLGVVAADHDHDVGRVAVEGLEVEAVAAEADGDDEVLHGGNLGVGSGEANADAGGDGLLAFEDLLAEFLLVGDAAGTAG